MRVWQRFVGVYKNVGVSLPRVTQLGEQRYYTRFSIQMHDIPNLHPTLCLNSLQP